MIVKIDAIKNLQALVGQENFAQNGLLYTGVVDPQLRSNLNSKYVMTITLFISAIESKSTQKEYLALLASEINKFKRKELDSEDAEQIAGNFELIMDYIGLEISEGILNNWMYGFDPTEFKNID